jgi:hypothetical protein
LVLCSIVVIGAGIFVLLLHKPADFVQPEPIKDSEVSKYLTHVLSRDLYNGAQREEPFKLVISQEGINDIVARCKWPQQVGGVSISVPEIIFEPGTIVLRGIVSSVRLELLVTVSGTASTNEDGLLNLVVRNVKVGALNVTVLARAVAQSLYENEMANREPKPDSWSEKIFAAILQGEPFDPVLEIEDKRVRIGAVDIAQGRMTLYMVPADMNSIVSVSTEQKDG